MIEDREILHYHGFAGLAGGAMGFNRGHARVGNLRARMRCIGGFDVDAAACRDFLKNTGVPCTRLDLFSRDQYIAFHGKLPPADWREATPADIQRSAWYERPNIVFLSAPCKGFSGLLSEARSKDGKYQALNQLAERALWLMLEAWKDDPPELFIFENVPRIITRGAALVDRLTRLLQSFGYLVTTPPKYVYDCGEIGHLAQSRKRFLMVARHQAKVPAFLYEPPKRPLRAVGDILGRMPLPGDPIGGPMHAIPNLQWKTWVRLAFVEAGSDWRSLNKLRVKDGKLQDYLIIPETAWEGTGRLGVTEWSEPAVTIQGSSRPENGKFSVADPRQIAEFEAQQYGVLGFNETSGVITSQRSPGQGAFSVADPRIDGVRHNNIFRIVRWDENSQAITAGGHPTAGGQAVADPRPPDRPLFRKYAVTPWDANTGTVIGGHHSEEGGYAVADPRAPRKFTDKKYKVTDFGEPANSVIGASTTVQGAFAVADPRIKRDRDDYKTAGEYGVVPWTGPSGACQAQGQYDNGRWSVADPRLPAETQKLVCVIRALDGTWHRPFTTLELAALQSLVDPEMLWTGTPWDLDGNSDSAKRERIGNAVPPAAAEAIASVMAETLLLSWSGQRFKLSDTPIWVRPIAVALSVKAEVQP